MALGSTANSSPLGRAITLLSRSVPVSVSASVECAVAFGMAEAIVDRLEIVQVEEQQHGVTTQAIAQAQHLTGENLEAAPVRQLRERVGGAKCSAAISHSVMSARSPSSASSSGSSERGCVPLTSGLSWKWAAGPATGVFGSVRIDEDAVRSGCHEPALRPDAESAARCLKVLVAVP
ncbi:hypothetical protein [Burkholderia pyrrocinia]|uniref:hypothetical protein n=1 Tax=Burkholderia pyrrocinia TaxID=60550 RepID=UPI003D9A2DF3